MVNAFFYLFDDWIDVWWAGLYSFDKINTLLLFVRWVTISWAIVVISRTLERTLDQDRHVCIHTSYIYSTTLLKGIHPVKIMTVVFAFVQAVAMSAWVGYLFCHVAKQHFFPENDPRASKLTLTRGFFETHISPYLHF